MKRFQFAGNRVIKTGVAIFLTAWICELLHWPPVFAVITAIVTIEPTVSDSIKKGIIRFPASAIGSAYAVLFISLFGNSAITYTLAAVFTIATCYKLKLHAGLLVATLTSVAMIEVIHSNYLVSFFVRLGTTTTGLIVSTLVNFLILRPNYTKEILENVSSVASNTGRLIEQTFKKILENNNRSDQSLLDMITSLRKKSQQTELLIRFQKDEAKYHPLVGSEKDQFNEAQKKLLQLRLMQYHIDNLMNTPLETLSWTEEERQMILASVHDLAISLQDKSHYRADLHQDKLKRLMEQFWEDNEEITKNNDRHPTHFTPELIVLYELLSIYNLVFQYYEYGREKQTP